MLHPMHGMMSSLDDLRIFVAVARERSFAGAARRLGVPLSTVSRRVACLEEAMRCRLLQRTSRRVAVTQDGERLLARAAPAVDELAAATEAVRDAEAAPAGALRVTAPVVTGAEWVAPALLGLARRHPGLAIELVLGNAVVDLIEHQLDLAIRVGPIRDRAVIARPLRTVAYGLCAAEDFVARELGGRSTLRVDRLRALPAVLAHRDATWRLRRRSGAIETVRPAARFIVNDPRVGLAAVADGMGVAALPLEMIARDRRVVALTVVGRTAEPRALFAVYPARRQLPSRVRVAIDWLVQAAARYASR